jgi:hypothetical protein
MSFRTASSRKISLMKLNSTNAVVPAWAGYIVTYNFTSNNATAVFNGITITGNYSGTSSGGTYSVSTTSYSNGGSNGGAGGATGIGPPGAGGVGGSIGAADGGGSYFASPPGHNNISGLDAAVVGAGYNSSFGNGGAGSGSQAAASGGNFAGGGGGGGGFEYGRGGPGGSGGNAAIVLQYIVSGTNTYQVINQSAGSGSYTFPTATSYVKIWAVGRGSDGGYGQSVGGGAGGVAWCEFK